MKKFLYISLMVLTLLLAGTGTGYTDDGGRHGGHNGFTGHGGHGGFGHGGRHGGFHGGRGGIGIWVGPEVWSGWWGSTYPYDTPPIVLQPQEPEIYVQPVEPDYWYYCRDPRDTTPM